METVAILYAHGLSESLEVSYIESSKGVRRSLAIRWMITDLTIPTGAVKNHPSHFDLFGCMIEQSFHF